MADLDIYRQMAIGVLHLPATVTASEGVVHLSPEAGQGVLLVPGGFHILADFTYYGPNKVVGYVKRGVSGDLIPAKAYLVLMDQGNWQVIRTGVSDPVTGYYEFTELLPGIKYAVVALDPLHQNLHAIADKLEAI